MTWIKLDDNAVDHPKVASLTDRAFRWWVRGLSYASRYLTDGMLPKVFWKQVPNSARTELISSRLWDWIDPHFVIHDYHHHQSTREDVEYEKSRNRAKAAAYRAKKRGLASGVTGDATGDVTGKSPEGSYQVIPNPENREHIHITENRVQTTATPSVRGVGLVMNGAQFERLQQTHAFVGPMLRVPNALHAELLSKSGNRDAELRAWYSTLDAELEQSGKGTGDVFMWLRPRHQAFALAQGWIDAPPAINTRPKVEPINTAKLLEREAQRKAERLAVGGGR